MQAALVILDGWGLGRDGGRDAVLTAETPVFDRLSASGAVGRLDVSGRRVGLPDGQMGNSEVGHLNIGAGRVVRQAYTRISDAIEDGTFAENPVFAAAFDHAESHGGRVHFMGLVSDGGVHSHQSHLHALVELAAERDADAVTHAFTDGRDTPPTAGAGYLRRLEAVVEQAGTGDVATVIGRHYAMDRDHNWERIREAFEAIVDREADYSAETAVEAAENAYDREETDEFVAPTLVTGAGEGEEPSLRDGDAVVFFNFRADRARQLVRLLAGIEPEWPFEVDRPAVHLTTMTEYDECFDLPVAFSPEEPTDTLGEALARADRTQARLAESEKYAHVTYFLNGGREVAFEGEIRRIVDSPDVPTYDLQPAMSAEEVTDVALELVEERDPDVLVLNYANPDMVGHTGDFDAAVAAVEAVDEQLGRLIEGLQRAGAHVVVTADHGNADDMGTPEDPHTAHTDNPVPFVYLSPAGDDGGYAVREGGSLCDVAPTLLSLVGVEKPPAMTGESLLVCERSR